jgi:hypothetical protein
MALVTASGPGARYSVLEIALPVLAETSDALQWNRMRL